VAESEGLAEEDIAVAEVVVVVKVAAAETGGCYADLQFI